MHLLLPHAEGHVILGPVSNWKYYLLPGVAVLVYLAWLFLAPEEPDGGTESSSTGAQELSSAEDEPTGMDPEDSDAAAPMDETEPPAGDTELGVDDVRLRQAPAGGPDIDSN